MCTLKHINNKCVCNIRLWCFQSRSFRLLLTSALHFTGHLQIGLDGGHPVDLLLHRQVDQHPHRPCLGLVRLDAVSRRLSTSKEKSPCSLPHVSLLFCPLLDDPFLFKYLKPKPPQLHLLCDNFNEEVNFSCCFKYEYQNVTDWCWDTSFCLIKYYYVALSFVYESSFDIFIILFFCIRDHWR